MRGRRPIVDRSLSNANPPRHADSPLLFLSPLIRRPSHSLPPLTAPHASLHAVLGAIGPSMGVPHTSASPSSAALANRLSRTQWPRDHGPISLSEGAPPQHDPELRATNDIRSVLMGQQPLQPPGPASKAPGPGRGPQARAATRDAGSMPPPWETAAWNPRVSAWDDSGMTPLDGLPHPWGPASGEPPLFVSPAPAWTPRASAATHEVSAAPDAPLSRAGRSGAGGQAAASPSLMRGASGPSCAPERSGSLPSKRSASPGRLDVESGIRKAARTMQYMAPGQGKVRTALLRAWDCECE